MRDPEMFKYDVRVRERMLKAGRLTPDDLANVLAGLPDVEANGLPIDLDQPALGRSEGGAAARESRENRENVVPAPVAAPAAPPAPVPVAAPVPPPAPVAAPAPVEAPAPAAPAVSATPVEPAEPATSAEPAGSEDSDSDAGGTPETAP